MKTLITTTVCDMPHTEPATAETTAKIVLFNSGSRTVTRMVDLCDVCAKQFVEPVFLNGRKVKP